MKRERDGPGLPDWWLRRRRRTIVENRQRALQNLRRVRGFCKNHPHFWSIGADLCRACWRELNMVESDREELRFRVIPGSQDLSSAVMKIQEHRFAMTKMTAQSRKGIDHEDASA